MHRVCMYLTYSDCDTCVRGGICQTTIKIEEPSMYHRVKKTTTVLVDSCVRGGMVHLHAIESSCEGGKELRRCVDPLLVWLERTGDYHTECIKLGCPYLDHCPAS
jgi:hypothetical protein